MRALDGFFRFGGFGGVRGSKKILQILKYILQNSTKKGFGGFGGSDLVLLFHTLRNVKHLCRSFLSSWYHEADDDDNGDDGDD